MEGESKQGELQSLLDAIKESAVLETRIPLISRLGELYHSENCDLAFLVQFLATFWVGSTCSGFSHCLLNKTILNVAEKYLNLNESSCLIDFLVLGTKASVWCGEHIQKLVVSAEGSGDEKHSTLFSQLILDALSYSSTTTAALIRYPMIGEKMEILVIENFVLEQMSLTKTLIFEIKKFHSVSAEVLKMAASVLNSMVKLCRVYFQSIMQKSGEMNGKKNMQVINGIEENFSVNVINIIACTIKTLCEMGIYAASGGGSLVTLLNLSWKGIVSLLQLVKGISSEKINVREVIHALVSLATGLLRSAAEGWSSSTVETMSITEAKRVLLLVKFFFINAVRISSDYPSEAVKMYEEIITPVLIVTSLVVSLCRETDLRLASEVLAEVVEPSSFLLLQTLLISLDVKPESKNHILDWLFKDRVDSGTVYPGEVFGSDRNPTCMDNIFAFNCESIPAANHFLVGKVVLFLNLLKVSSSFREEVVVEISTRLDDFLDFLVHEEVYSSILSMQIPFPCSSGSATGVAWQSIFTHAVHSLTTFVVVASSSTPACLEVERFLLRNSIHPHFLCKEIVMDLWCFLISHSETELVNDMLGRLYSLLKLVASSESSLRPLCALRQMAKSTCSLLCYAEPDTVNKLCRSILNDTACASSPIVLTALLMEGFSLDSLSNSMRVTVTQKLVVAFNDFLGDFQTSASSDSLCLPVHALSALLSRQQIKYSDVMSEINSSELMKFTHTLIHGYRDAAGKMKDQKAQLLGAALDIISSEKDVFGTCEIGELVLELQVLLAEDSVVSDPSYCLLQPSVASFMAALCHLELPEEEGSAICSAVYHLYHTLLRERQWASAHSALAAFSYFAARTTWKELWRFVPLDAALSFDMATGAESDEDRFMFELKDFLEKERALPPDAPCEEQRPFLVEEGRALKQLHQVVTSLREVSKPDAAENDNEDNDDDDNEVGTRKKKRKFPDGIGEGVALLRSGLELMSNAVAGADTTEAKEAFSSHLSRLQELISHLQQELSDI